MTILAVTFASLLGLSCTAFRGYHLTLNGFASPDIPLRVSPDNTFALVTNPDAENEMFEKEVIRKTGLAMEQAGVKVLPREEADYLIMVTYGLGGERPVDSWDIDPVFDIMIFPDPRIFFRGFTFSPVRRGAYLHWMEVNVIESEPFDRDGTRSIVWLAQIACLSPSNDLRETVDAMLVGAMEIFGTDTGRAESEVIEPWDARLDIFRQPDNP